MVFDGNYYSVPYNLVHELVEIRSTPTTVEIFHKGKRVASHLRSRGDGQMVTNARASPQEPPRASGVDAVANGELGAEHRPEHGAAVRAHP